MVYLTTLNDDEKTNLNVVQILIKGYCNLAVFKCNMISARLRITTVYS